MSFEKSIKYRTPPFTKVNATGLALMCIILIIQLLIKLFFTFTKNIFVARDTEK